MILTVTPTWSLGCMRTMTTTSTAAYDSATLDSSLLIGLAVGSIGVYTV